MSTQEVTLTLNQVQRYETCRAVMGGRMTVRAAAGALGLSERRQAIGKQKVGI